jgi:hypothetical protein
VSKLWGFGRGVGIEKTIHFWPRMSAGELFDKGTSFAKYQAYAMNTIGNELHRQNVYQVRMNNVAEYPQIIEILWSRKEKDFVAQRFATVSRGGGS